MITTVKYTSASNNTVAVVMIDGLIYCDDVSLPADTYIRKLIAAWVAEGNMITAYTVPSPTLEDQLAAIETEFDKKKALLTAQLLTVTLFDGEAEAVNKTTLQAIYAQLCNDKAAAIEALLFGGL